MSHLHLTRSAPSRWSLRTALSLALLLSLMGCGDDSEGDDAGGTRLAGESCANTSECESGLLCLGGICKDPNDTPNNDVNNDVNNDTPNNDPNNDVPNNDPNNDVPNNDVNNDTPNNDVNNDVVERPERLTGGVSVFEVNVTANVIFSIKRGNIGAAFVEPTQDPAPIATFGECDLVQVTQNQPDPFGYSAGPITVEIDGESQALTPMAGGGGSFVYGSDLSEDNEDVFGPGSTITIRSQGGPHISAFEGTLTAPPQHTLTSPSADSRVSSGQDLTLSWSGAGSGAEVAIAISPMDQFFSFLDGRGLNCAPASDTGSLTIPAAALAELNAQKLAIVVVKVVNQSVTAGSDELVLNVTSAAGNIVNFN